MNSSLDPVDNTRHHAKRRLSTESNHPESRGSESSVRSSKDHPRNETSINYSIVDTLERSNQEMLDKLMIPTSEFGKAGNSFEQIIEKIKYEESLLSFFPIDDRSVRMFNSRISFDLKPSPRQTQEGLRPHAKILPRAQPSTLHDQSQAQLSELQFSPPTIPRKGLIEENCFQSPQTKLPAGNKPAEEESTPESTAQTPKALTQLDTWTNMNVPHHNLRQKPANSQRIKIDHRTRHPFWNQQNPFQTPAQLMSYVPWQKSLDNDQYHLENLSFPTLGVTKEPLVGEFGEDTEMRDCSVWENLSEISFTQNGLFSR